MSQPTSTDKKSGKSAYKGTLNLPKTSFPMKANLVQNEPATQKRWKKTNLYRRVQEAREGAERFVFHDGPPYANGSIHMGHLLNKCLKDFVVRSRVMAGKSCPYVPGWDCHGLPIEHKVMTEMAGTGKLDKLNTLDPDTRCLAIRRECERYASRFQKLQSSQMERLLTMADYDDPYLTMRPEYEGAVLDVLAALLEQGIVFRALKPVYWSIANETALAEAELEYQDREDISVYVDFELVDRDATYRAFGLSAESQPEVAPSLMIWTTTPWTLPANMAVAVHERSEYSLVRVDGNVTILASALVERVTSNAKAEDVEVLATANGTALLGLEYRHPFVSTKQNGETDADVSLVWTVVSADYVTLEDGTGLVHTATGHGTDDYLTGMRVGLPIYCPVQNDGTYDESVPDWLVGLSIWDANQKVTDHLRSSGHLFYDHRFTHSYPHDWRSKTPVIFRSTEQWFIAVDQPLARGDRPLREMALEATSERIGFVPEWGRNRMRGMLESRPDWCISRQRAWGLPIPAFFTPEGTPFMTKATVRAVADVIREKGSDVWFNSSASDLLANYDPSTDPDAPDGLDVASLTKGRDIFDVWFESGSSWNAVVRQRNQGFPIELYLEGSDQHRGWFQLSMLPALGMLGEPPFKKILTHGFMVGKDGHPLSKSKGDTIDDLFHKYGADVLRWWVCSLNYENDMKVDDDFFGIAGESYRKVRNTLRFMLSNLSDFTPTLDGQAGECVDLSTLAPTSLEAWVLDAYNRCATRVLKAYESYNFRDALLAIYDFCNDTLSSVYLAAVKDRLYCDRADSARRKQTQSVLWDLTDGLTRLLAPILCHTADEAHRALHRIDAKDLESCVHLRTYIEHFDVSMDDAWPGVLELRQTALKALERERADARLALDNPLDAAIVVPHSADLERFEACDLADLLGVSQVRLDADASEVGIVDLRGEPRCERSWKRDGTVRERSDGGMLTDRDALALGL